MHEVAGGGSFEPIEVKAQDELFRGLTASFNHLLGKLGDKAGTKWEPARVIILKQANGNWLIWLFWKSAG